MPESFTIPAEQLAAVKNIDGWLSDREAGLLWSCAREATGPIVEIGSYAGRSTAALGLGSMAGHGFRVIAVDAFVQVDARNGRQAFASSSPERLRANLDAAGVNGLVSILAKTAKEALIDIPPQIDTLFVDGNHDETANDLFDYLPFVREGGTVVLHDFEPGEPHVMAAASEHILSRPDQWQFVRRCDSCLVARKRPTPTRAVMLAIPGDHMDWSVGRVIAQATFGGHAVDVQQSGHGWDDMNELWVRGLNAARDGSITHFVMLHTDIAPYAGWLDCLLAELDETGADMVSAVSPIKDPRGLTSCGVGDHADPWSAHRRWTMRELAQFPETFSLYGPDVDYTTQHYLLHNTGCWAADLRNDTWFATEEPDRELVAAFKFNIRARKLASGKLLHERESEDWYFSRRIAELGLKTLVTRKVELCHIGKAYHPNYYPWGQWEHDEETRPRWDPNVARRMPA